MLVKEVHHRIKNNLQGVAGLMQQIALRRPEVAAVLQEAVGQVQAIAQVYGLQVGAAGPLRVRSVIEAITASVQRMFGRRIVVEVQGPATERWALPEAESIPIALTINELLTNAIKHGGADAEVRCTLVCSEEGVSVAVANSGRLPPGFGLAQVPGGVSGLGLVRALLPRRGATLTLAEEAGDVVARITLVPPGVAVLSPT
jgi:two-component sensor histidine kinase